MIKPMLAYKVNKKPVDWDEKVFMQPKLDGVRCIIQLDDSGKTMAYSRTGKPWKNIEHILDNLQPWFDFHPDVILDGELYNHDLRDNFEKIISLVRKQKPTDKDRLEAKKLVQFHCYDYANGHELYSSRMKNLNTTKMYSYCVIYVPTKQVLCDKGTKVIHGANLHKGYEGSILRDAEAEYRFGSRPMTMMKLKKFFDEEYELVDIIPTEKDRDSLGRLTCLFLCKTKEGKLFKVTPSGYNKTEKADMLIDKHVHLGQPITVKYYEKTKNKLPFHANGWIRDYES
jgi:ATP-dependent DNA ligase